MAWDEKAVAMLTRLWADGVSAEISAKHMTEACGRKFTRNMIISKVHRLRLPKRETRNRISPSAGQKSGWHKARAAVAKPATKPKKIETATVFEAEPFVGREIDVPETQRKSLEDLGDRDCRYPFGDGPYTFCARQKVAGMPYCSEHVAIAYQPVKPARPSGAPAKPLRIVAGTDFGHSGGDGTKEDQIAASGLPRAKERV